MLGFEARLAEGQRDTTTRAKGCKQVQLLVVVSIKFSHCLIRNLLVLCLTEKGLWLLPY